jgi:hypothetical protein
MLLEFSPCPGDPLLFIIRAGRWESIDGQLHLQFNPAQGASRKVDESSSRTSLQVTG